MITGDSQYLAVGASSATFANAMLEGAPYLFCASVAAWIAIGSSPTAAKQTGGSIYVPANVPLTVFCPSGGAKLAVIEDSAAGSSTLTRCES